MATQRELCYCPIDAAVQTISGKWKIIILWKLRDKPMRFGELKRAVSGITEKMLIQQLRELEQDEIICRQDFQEMPLRVEYSLTPQGRKLSPVFDALWQWGEDHIRHQRQEKLAQSS
ncbi:helix-turn-helix transcriptional regulator [Leptolyngbya sp. NK1-12]|uniref:Helix-turn-helix transcriptional regulator n=2 Tax=Leptolyngbya sp. NK1-12 TaxID=2547451 RepID=A0AA96WKA4_9CYAN|nr:helix-turn-helix transcriptional regulator [Leptolyngbya sp. NK1-12]